MMQLSLLDALHAPPVIIPVDPGGPVVQGPVDELLQLPHSRYVWNLAEIELHRHADGLWMWSASWHCEECGSGYRVGPKWGKFARTRDDALFYAAGEIKSALSNAAGADARKIIAWLASL